MTPSKGIPLPERPIPIRELTTTAELHDVLEAPRAILLKHGSHCMISRAARTELDGFSRAHPDVALSAIEVTGRRELSNAVVERLGVRHESPQLLVLRDGAVAWKAEHFDITAGALEEALGKTGGPLTTPEPS